MDSVIFENPGEIDSRLVTTFGTNVKDSDSAIGFFGTGLKYAIAILLRTGHEIEIQSGMQILGFSITSEVIRGKQFDFIAMNGEVLGFTTEVGKSWDLWMAYRELYCNVEDESGSTYRAAQSPEPSAGVTRVIVRGEQFLNVHDNHARYFLDTIPVWECGRGEIHNGPGNGIYFRKVLVAQFGRDQESLYKYNIKTGIELTEDRTAKKGYEVESAVAAMVLTCDSADIIEDIITAPKGLYENKLDLDWGATPGAVFLDVVRRLSKSRLVEINPSALAVYRSKVGYIEDPEVLIMTSVEKEMLRRAIEFCHGMGVHVENEIVAVERLGSGTLGMAYKGRIYITKEAFRLGTKQVAGTLIEEHLHITTGHGDMTRGMQEHLLNWVVSLGEQLRGEPL